MIHVHDTRPLRGCPVATIDFETTGPDPHTCEPVSVAVVHSVLGHEAESQVVAYQSLIRPTGPIPPEASEIHGITEADVVHAPRLVDVMLPLCGALNGRLLCAYNLPFDWLVLTRQFKPVAAYYSPISRTTYKIPTWGGLDPLVWVRALHRYDKGEGRHTLATIAGRYDVPLSAHQATADATATAQLLPLLLRALVRHRDGPRGSLEGGALTVADLWRWQVEAALTDELRFALHVATRYPLDRAPSLLRWRDLTRRHWSDIQPPEKPGEDR